MTSDAASGMEWVTRMNDRPKSGNLGDPHVRIGTEGIRKCQSTERSAEHSNEVRVAKFMRTPIVSQAPDQSSPNHVVLHATAQVADAGPPIAVLPESGYLALIFDFLLK